MATFAELASTSARRGGHQRAVEGRAHLERDGLALLAADTSSLTRATARGVPGDHDLPGRVEVRAGSRTSPCAASRADRLEARRLDAHDRRHRAHRPAAPRPASPARARERDAPRPRAPSAPAATSAEYSPSEWPAANAGVRAATGTRSRSAARIAQLVATIAGCVFAVSVSVLRALEMSVLSFSPSAASASRRPRRAAAEASRTSFAMPTALRALTGEQPCDLHGLAT